MTDLEGRWENYKQNDEILYRDTGRLDGVYQNNVFKNIEDKIVKKLKKYKLIKVFDYAENYKVHALIDRLRKYCNDRANYNQVNWNWPEGVPIILVEQKKCVQDS